MTIPCAKEKEIEDQGKRILLQSAAIARIEEHISASRKSQEKQTQILVDMARTQERYLSLADKTEVNRVALHDLSGKVDKGFAEVFTRMRKLETRVCTSGGKRLDGERFDDGKWDKGQIALWTAAVGGFFGFLFQTMTYFFDKIAR